MIMAMTTETTPTISAMRAPKMMRESMSRPKESVPAQWAREGPESVGPTPWASGS
jgi:hypothetical protein